MIVLVAAVIWWFSFYIRWRATSGRLTGVQAGRRRVRRLSCLYSSSGICALVSGVATLAGRTPYEPMVFWFGLAAVVLGLLIRFTAKPSGAA